MAKKPIVCDVGELGWSLYLVGHLRFLRSYYNFNIDVMTYPDRACLYKQVADNIFKLPDEFYEKFDISEQECFGIKASSDPTSKDELMAFFLGVIPQHCYIPPGFAFTCKAFGMIYSHEPFQYKTINFENPEQKEILVFPRARGGRFLPRNLPVKFYVELIWELCKQFPQHTVRTMGTESGAYKIDKVIAQNYICSVDEGADLQRMIDRCQIAIAAIGSQSAPPKITLLQGVPTFMIGHEKERHTKLENWKQTECGFYETHNYQNFDFKLCIDSIIRFIRSLDESPIIISDA